MAHETDIPTTPAVAGPPAGQQHSPPGLPLLGHHGGHYPVMMDLTGRSLTLGSTTRGSGPAAAAGAGPISRAASHDEPVLVHWCHGSPGAVLLFCKAFQVGT